MRKANMDRRGATAIITALGMVALVGFAGLAVDTARAWLVEDRLKTAMDAAALVAARHMSDPAATRNAEATAVFWTQFSQGGSSHSYLGATVTAPTFTPITGDSSKIRIGATASIPTTLFGVISKQTVAFSDFSVAQRTGTGLEVALVLDNTGSMANWSDSSPGSPIQAVIASANNLLDVLYGSSDTQPNLWVSVVPFAATVNINSTRTNWLVPGSLDQSKYSPSKWMGCVMARTVQTGAANGDDSNDTPPSAGHYFQPFLYTSTYHQYPKNGIAYGSGKTWWYPGDNDWVAANWTKNGNSAVQGDGKSGVSNEPDGGNEAVGPNLGCPSLAVLPETTSKTAVAAVINQMVPVYRGGTFINLGLQAGWWTISPNWQTMWGTPPDPKLKDLPLAYNTPHMKKAIVLMTDGNNNWNDWNCGVPGQQPPTSGCPWTTNPPQGVPKWTADGDTDFTAYGRLKSNVANLPTNNATTTLNNLMSNMCSTIKQNGIVIYTILFNHDSSVLQSTKTLFQSCASTPNDYFLAPTQADLQAAFQQIGSQLASLRLAQ
jgi:Flp pilus assembly protein TadG